MCGFVGIRDAELSPNDGGQRLAAALSSIAKRGPDGRGEFADGRGFRVGHVRLAIIDTTTAAAQPMVSGDGRLVLVLNGEIYNYKELYEQHCRELAWVNPRSDTSVLLGLYSLFGRRCLELLNGMFAFAVFDVEMHSLFLARDRFGEKPLYWSQSGARFAFASELKALRQLARNQSYDLEALALFHLIGSIPAPRTAYAGLNAVLPGAWLEVSAEGRIERGIYWSAVANVAIRTAGDRSEVIAGVRQRMRQAVATRMVSDVPVGVFLSGGIDSGSILAFCADQGTRPDIALTLDFEEERFSESVLAEATAKRYGVPLTRRVVKEEEFSSSLVDYFREMDQPTSDGYNTYFVSKFARELGVKVWLSGVGGDEVFGGYPSFKRISRLTRMSRVLQAIAAPAYAHPLVKLAPNRTRAGRLLNLGRFGDPRVRAYQTCRMTLPLESARELFCGPLQRQLSLELLDSAYPEIPSEADDLQVACLLESLVYMQSQLVRDMDNFSMCHSIELRAPFLDHRLFEFTLSLPRHFRDNGAAKKKLLVDSAPEALPQEVSEGPKKGFTFPVETWIRQRFASEFESAVLSEQHGDLWNIEALTRLWRACQAGRAHWSVLWSFYAFAQWRRHAGA
jgi:asparagine synthase (glutamine-hydrolysing)